MSLKIKEIHLSTWRNFNDLTLELSPGITVLVGPNATGKTNTIEALQYLTAASSFRKPSPSELIAQGSDTASIQARIEGNKRVLDVEMSVSDRSRKFYKNSKATKSSDFIGTLLSVLFCPDDLLLIKGSASKRRDEIDNFGIQAHKSYRNVYSTYMRSIEQRNHLLKEGVGGVLLDSWDQSVALGAATLLLYRLSLFNKLSCYVEDIYQQITNKEQLTCSYISSFIKTKDKQLVLPSGVAVEDSSKEELVHFIEEALLSNRDEDMRRGQTSIGPHRDDILFELNGKNARTFGSQGQQRSIVLAWKMAEVRFCEELFGNCPLLLLDDVKTI